MKRFHVHMNVNDLDSNIRFYSILFGAAPTIVKVDYAKWMLDDPRVNFAISQRGRTVGVDHLGLQADDAEELAAIGGRLLTADTVALAEKGTTCCYARSDKFWAEDPQGMRWESFHTFGEATTYTSAPAQEVGASCCGPQSGHAVAASCGPKSAGSCC